MTQAHQAQRRFAYWKIGIVVFVVIGIMVGTYFTLRYTVIADAIESQSGVDTADALAYGALLFETRGCTGCHQHDASGSDGDTGPDLTHISARSDMDYIHESIVNPNAVIAQECPEEACEANIMPNYSNILSSDQIDALVIYLSSDQ